MLDRYAKPRKYKGVYLTFSEKYRDIKYTGDDISLTHLYKSNMRLKNDINYQFDTAILMSVDKGRYKERILFDYLSSCRNNYDKDVTIINISDDRCNRQPKDRVIDLIK